MRIQTQSNESDRLLEQAIANLERLGQFYARYALHLRKRFPWIQDRGAEPRCRGHAIRSAIVFAVLLAGTLPQAEDWSPVGYQSEPKPFPARGYEWRDNRGFG